MRIAALLAAALLGAGAVPVLAQANPDPVPIEAWSLERVSAMGQAIYRQDQAAAVSTDALLAHLNGSPPPADMVGWIVVEQGRDQRVRYLRQAGGEPRAAFDVVVRNGRAGPVEAVDEALSDAEKARFRARLTAAENIGRLRCSERLNAVVLDDPDSDGWLVWLLTSTNDANLVPMGGNYRFHISADGGTMIRRDMLSNSCMTLSKAPNAQGARPVALTVSQIVSDGPVETHVFLSLLHRMAIYVAAGDKVYSVEGDRIRLVDR